MHLKSLIPLWGVSTLLLNNSILIQDMHPERPGHKLRLREPEEYILECCGNTYHQGTYALLWGAGIRIVLALVLVILSGCSSKTNYVDNSRDFSRDIVHRLEKNHRLKTTMEEEKPTEQELIFSFHELLLRAAQNDKGILLILADLKKDHLEIEGARSYLWPRLNVSLDAREPLTGDYEVDVTGGVFADYDIWKAIAVKDEMVLRKALVEKNLNQLRLTLQNLQLNITEQLLSISFIEEKYQNKQRELELSRKAYVLAKVYGQQQNLNFSSLLAWKNRVNVLEAELKKIEQERTLKESLISDLLGMDVEQKITIKDWNQLSRNLSQVSERNVTLSKIWDRHSEARLYELELVAAEVALDLMAYEKLPKIGATIGVGSVPLRNELDPASAVLQIKMSMPLFDQGDYKRKLARRRIDRDRIKQQMKLTVTHFWNRYQLARSAFRQAEKRVALLEKTIEESRKQVEKGKVLVTEGRGNNLNLYLEKIATIDVEILKQEALMGVKIAANKLRYASGDDSVFESIETIVEALYKGSDEP